MFNPSQNLLGKFRCLSQKSDCLLFALARTPALAVSANFSLACLSSLYRFQGSLAAALATTYDSIAKAACFVNTFPNSFFRKFFPIMYAIIPHVFTAFFDVNRSLTHALFAFLKPSLSSFAIAQHFSCISLTLISEYSPRFSPNRSALCKSAASARCRSG